MIVLGLQVTTGYAGQINLGQAAFMRRRRLHDRFSSATKLGFPSWLTIPLGGCSAAVFGFIRLSAVRIKGFYLALTTIAAQALFHFLVLNPPWFGGSNGLTLDPASLFGSAFATDISIYYLCPAVAALMTSRLRHGWGAGTDALVVVRDDDVAAGIMGIDVVATKATAAFLVGAFYAGVGGGLWAYFVRFVAGQISSRCSIRYGLLP